MGVNVIVTNKPLYEIFVNEGSWKFLMAVIHYCISRKFLMAVDNL